MTHLCLILIGNIGIIVVSNNLSEHSAHERHYSVYSSAVVGLVRYSNCNKFLLGNPLVIISN